MDSTTALSIIIVNYNTKALLKRCIESVLESLAKSPLRVEIIVIDNGSSDGSYEYLESQKHILTCVYNRENVGFGKANNQAVQIAKGQYVLLLNSDTVVIDKAIDKLYTYAKQKPRSFVGGKLMNLDGTAQPSCGPFFSLPVVFAMLFLKGDAIGLTRFSPKRPQKVDWISGACIMAAKKIFSDDLFFDEAIFLYMEEIDLLYRGKRKGYSTYFYPYAHFTHVGAASTPEGRRKPVLFIYKGLLYFYGKHRSWMACVILRFMLRTKAILGYCIGLFVGSDYLKKTYAQAYKQV